MALNKTLWRNPNTKATQGAEALRKVGQEEKAKYIDKIAKQPDCIWIGDWEANPGATIDKYLTRANGETVVFVLYSIPRRDCGSYSAGGHPSQATYLEWVKNACTGFKGREAVVIVEPDGLSVTKCLSPDELVTRLVTYRKAIKLLRREKCHVYIDISEWAPVQQQADRLLLAGIRQAEGFALNVSLSQTTEACHAYAKKINEALGMRKRYVIDVGRNGSGPPADRGNDWCNPKSLRIGVPPTMETGVRLCTAYLWVKQPGGSDGDCLPGEPKAGAWFEDYALRLAGYYDKK